MNCIVCGRPLKNPTTTGAGSTCAKKLRSNPDAGKKQTRVELIYKQGSTRRYLVFTDPRQVVTVNETGDGRFATCRDYSHQIENKICVHIEATREKDYSLFPATAVLQGN